MTTEAGIQDYKFKEPSSPLWIPASVDFRSFRFSFEKWRKMKMVESKNLKDAHGSRKPEL